MGRLDDSLVIGTKLVLPAAAGVQFQPKPFTASPPLSFLFHIYLLFIQSLHKCKKTKVRLQIILSTWNYGFRLVKFSNPCQIL